MFLWKVGIKVVVRQPRKLIPCADRQRSLPMEYTACAELDLTSADLGEAETDRMADAVFEHRGDLARSLLGRVRLDVVVHADDLDHAIAVARAVLRDCARGHEMVSFSVAPTTDVERIGAAPSPGAWLSVSETAAELGVTRQAVLARISAGTLPATRIGSTWAVPRSGARWHGSTVARRRGP